MTPTTDRPPRTTEPLLIEELALAIGRHQGNTTAAVSSGATVLCRDAQEAQRLEREYRVKSVPVTRPERLRGMSCSFVLDVSALGVLAADARQCVERAKQLLAERDEKIAELEAAATTAQRRHCPRIGDGYCRNYYRGAPEMWCYLCRLLVPHDEATK